jgi:putative transposase
MKQIYDILSKQATKGALKDFANKWNHKYPYAVKSWEENWEEIIVFLTFQ